MCADGHLVTNEHSDLVAESAVTFTRLSKDQTHAGYCVVILERHASELHQLGNEELYAFWTDVAQIGRVIAELFHPVKLDTLVMGHLCPHVRCHVYPQYRQDDPHALINIQEGGERLSETEQGARVTTIQERFRANAGTH